MAHSHSHEHSDDHDHQHHHEHGKSKFQISRKNRLRAVIAISFSFFLAEIAIGFWTGSLALVADAFHYFNDLISFIIALIAVHKTESKNAPPESLSYGWSRASLLGAFFNGVFLLALGLSIALQSIERFISIEAVERPMLILIIGSVGLGLNLISALFLHEHDHSHGGHSHGTEESATHTSPSSLPSPSSHASHHHASLTNAPSRGMDLGIAGVLLHVCGDVINNIGVIISAVIIWRTNSPKRYYADPAVSLFIAFMIFLSAIPLTKRSGNILLQSAPPGVKLDLLKHDLESIPGVQSVHELHVWQLDQKKSVATAHVVVAEAALQSFMEKRKVLGECLHAYGIHSATLQPELAASGRSSMETVTADPATSPARWDKAKCGVTCGTLCEPLKCCI
ncbi:cation efflux protein/ zinc transporter-like protein [Periconia macrospinosa]|uniref:Cation efflux protein/ zinc transporter-like protein n=1 Tax=Periconia macrospinosa TaxID=97972 RepID=A0A2V1D7Y3_9PLEO|nr:cation efflux protein/ zinc transporter-like protein [Periconia macrospinosa]